MESKYLGVKKFLFEILNKGEKYTSDYAIAYYLLEHYKCLKDINIIEMAADCYVDRSTIRRFFQKNGLDNFQEFKINYNEEFEAHYYKDVPFENYNNYIADLNDKITSMMNEYSLKRDKSSDINNFIDILYEAKNIVVMGDGSFYGNMYSIQQNMLEVGKIVFLVTSNIKNNPVLNGLTEDDCIIVLSLKGEYYDGIKKSIIGQKCKKILLTLSAKEDWKDEFKYIAQLTKEPEKADEEVYRKYAMTYFIDIMLNTYKMKYGSVGKLLI